VHHPLRWIIPPLIVLAGIIWIYLPWRRHHIAQRERPHNNPHKPVSRNWAGSVLAVTLIVAFISAFILP
jgi:hypothetical protein